MLNLLVWSAARRLDKVTPNWYNRVNTSRLNLTSNYDCVLGQVYGDFQGGIDIYLRINDTKPTAKDIVRVLFFAIPCVFIRDMWAFSMPKATKHWINQIAKRKRKDEYTQLQELMSNNVLQEEATPSNNQPTRLPQYQGQK